MARLGLIPEDVTLPIEEGFLLCDEEGVGKVTLLSIIGKGGTAIAYKGIRNRNGTTVTCIVKEYFPEQKEKRGKYVREKIGETITIAERYRDAELKLQIENVQRELLANQNLYFNEEYSKNPEWNNSAYMYSAEYLCRLGDASYIALDSSEGETLYTFLKQKKLSVEESIRLIRQMLILVEHLYEKGYVHCDIKPENLWLRGEGSNQSMCLLDFGSAFRLSDYQIDMSKLSEAEVMEAAEQIMRNESIGSNTHGYSSYNIGLLENNKRIFNSTDHSLDRAKKLLNSINAVAIGDDLFSVVKVADRILEGTDLTEEQRASIKKVWEEVDRKNSDEGFRTIEELRKEIEIIDTILHRGAHPAVLERGLKESKNQLKNNPFDLRLLCDVK